MGWNLGLAKLSHFSDILTKTESPRQSHSHKWSLVQAGELLFVLLPFHHCQKKDIHKLACWSQEVRDRHYPLCRNFQGIYKRSLLEPGFPRVLAVKNLPAKAGDIRHRFDPWVKKTPWRRI